MPPSELDIDLDDELAVVDIEQAIADLDGIVAVRLVPGDRRPVDELHVVVHPERDPKQTVRDVQSLLIARHGVEIDRRVISVVQLSSDTDKRLHDGLPRLMLDAVQIEVRGEETSVTVELFDRDVPVRGCAGPIRDDGLAEATAEATLDAVGDRLSTTLRLLGAEIADVGSERVAVAAISATNGRSRDLLTGSAAVRRHEADAVARAVLDATNRMHRD